MGLRIEDGRREHAENRAVRPRRVGPGSAPTSARPQIGFDSAADRAAVLDWLDRGLRPGRPGRLRAEFPLLFDTLSAAKPIFLGPVESPQAFCLLWPTTFLIGSKPIRIGLLSFVYVPPAARGQGLGRTVVSEALAVAERESMGLVLLWSEADRLYAGLGFEEAGQAAFALFDRDILDKALSMEEPAPPDWTTEEANENDWPEIERIRLQRASRLALAPGALTRAAKTPDLVARVTRGPHGVEGFVLCGRGDDLQSIVHEWGGDPVAAMRSARGLLDDRSSNEGLGLLSPAAGDALAWRLRRAGALRRTAPLGWFRIADPEALSRDLRGLLPDPRAFTIEATRSAADPRGEPTTFSIRSAFGMVPTDSRALLRLFLGSPSPTNAPTPEMLHVLGEANASHLPLPFFVWGLESI